MPIKSSPSLVTPSSGLIPPSQLTADTTAANTADAPEQNSPVDSTAAATPAAPSTVANAAPVIADPQTTQKLDELSKLIKSLQNDRDTMRGEINQLKDEESALKNAQAAAKKHEQSDAKTIAALRQHVAKLEKDVASIDQKINTAVTKRYALQANTRQISLSFSRIDTIGNTNVKVGADLRSDLQGGRVNFELSQLHKALGERLQWYWRAQGAAAYEFERDPATRELLHHLSFSALASRGTIYQPNRNVAIEAEAHVGARVHTHMNNQIAKQDLKLSDAQIAQLKTAAMQKYQQFVSDVRQIINQVAPGAEAVIEQRAVEEAVAFVNDIVPMPITWRKLALRAATWAPRPKRSATA